MLFLKHSCLPCPDHVPIYEDNAAIIALEKANNITNRLRHTDAPLC